MNSHYHLHFQFQLLRLIARITSSVQASFILYDVFSCGTKCQISFKKLDVTDVYKNPKCEGFDRESGPMPF